MKQYEQNQPQADPVPAKLLNDIIILVIKIHTAYLFINVRVCTLSTLSSGEYMVITVL